MGSWTRTLIVVRDAPTAVVRRASESGARVAFEVGERVVAQSESTQRRSRSGVVEEVLLGESSPRYRIRWDDGHESVYTPAGGALRAGQRRKRHRQAAPWKPNNLRRGDPPRARRETGRHALSRLPSGRRTRLTEWLGFAWPSRAACGLRAVASRSVTYLFSSSSETTAAGNAIPAACSSASATGWSTAWRSRSRGRCCRGQRASLSECRR